MSPPTPTPVSGRWTPDRANAWYDRQPWLVGCNYVPATAINQIEMWQASTFDPTTIERELGWAADIGFNSLRVYLHDLVWAENPDGFYARIDQFLGLCAAVRIRPFFVFFDDCHFPKAQLGPQPRPLPAYHNSGWVNCPTRDVANRFSDGAASPDEVARLRGYVQGTIRHFADDDRILLWELYNEPGRGDASGGLGGSATAFGDRSARLVQASWEWARAIDPTQPIASTTAGSVGEENIAINRANSDVHSIHAYGPPADIERRLADYQRDGRPIFCTEYLARELGSTPQSYLPILKEHRVAAINWGFVSGKTGTIWPWTSHERRDPERERSEGKIIPDGDPFPEPTVWFHDLLREDGTPFDPAEIDFIREITR